MLKWVVKASDRENSPNSQSTLQPSSHCKIRGVSKGSKDTLEVTSENSHKDTNVSDNEHIKLSEVPGSDIEKQGSYEFMNASDGPKRMLYNKTRSRSYSSGEADSLLDHTADSLSDDCEAVVMATDNLDAAMDSGLENSGMQNESTLSELVICHGHNADSGICQDADESCYNSGADTSFEVSYAPTQVTIATAPLKRDNTDNWCITRRQPRMDTKRGLQISANHLITQNKAVNTSDSSRSILLLNGAHSENHKLKCDKNSNVTNCNGGNNFGVDKTAEDSVDVCEISLDFSSEESPDDTEEQQALDDVFESEADSRQHHLTDFKQDSEETKQENIHKKRSRLVEQIDREIKLRDGAKNLFEASENRRLKDTISVEIRFIESHLKLLTDELAELDFNMENQAPNSRGRAIFPMIQLGFKQTKDVDCKDEYKKIISEHYYENGELYEKEIEAFESMRQLTRTPIRNEGGIELLFEYYNRLYFIDKRFYSPTNRPLVFFQWHDSISGKACIQKTIGFEKGSQLFNIGALHSHIAAHSKRSTEKEMLHAQEGFQKAAGIMRQLLDSFSNAPSIDMQPHTLKILTHLMLCQAQECHHDSARISLDSAQTTQEHITLSQHAALLYDMYRFLRQRMHFDSVKEYLPQNWHTLVQVKTLYYKALSNYHAAKAIMSTYKLKSEDRAQTERQVQDMFEPLTPSRLSVNIALVSQDLDDLAASRFFKAGDSHRRKYLAKACLSRSVLAHEEALRVHKQHQRVKRMPYYHDVHSLLKASHDRCLKVYATCEEEDDFTELSIVPNIKGKQDDAVKPISPDFSKYKVTDFFRNLGPLGIFCARHTWTAPLRVHMHKKSGQGFGFSVRGDAPVIIAEVDQGSLAEKAGMRVGDFIVEIDSHDAKWSRHEEVVKLIRAAGHNLILSLITPIDKNYLKPRRFSQDTQDSTDTDASGESPKIIPTGTLRPTARHRNAIANSRARPIATVSRSLDRTFQRDEQTRTSSKSIASFTWTLKKLRGKSRDKLHVQEVMSNESSYL